MRKGHFVPMQSCRMNYLPAAARTDFFIAGVQKAGTTALSTFLGEHPQVRMSAKKETHFFDKSRAGDWRNPDYASFHRFFDWNVGDVVRGEATPIYTYWPQCLERIQQYNPEAKIIILLRHPVLRAFSHWKMEASRGSEHLPFEDAIRRKLARPHRVYSYMDRGRYAGQVRNALRLFKRVHFVRTDSLWNSPSVTMNDIFTFLGVGSCPARRQYIAPDEVSPAQHLSPHIQKVLIREFEKDISETHALTGMDFSDWLRDDYTEPRAMVESW